MDVDITKIVQAIIKRAPAWIRQDLQSSDPQKRMVAEETLALRIAAALAKKGGQKRKADEA